MIRRDLFSSICKSEWLWFVKTMAFSVSVIGLQWRGLVDFMLEDRLYPRSLYLCFIGMLSIYPIKHAVTAISGIIRIPEFSPECSPWIEISGTVTWLISYILLQPVKTSVYRTKKEFYNVAERLYCNCN